MAALTCGIGHCDSTRNMYNPHIKVYEDVGVDECVEQGYDSVTEETWSKTIVVSWRWNESKPQKSTTGFSPMSNRHVLF